MVTEIVTKYEKEKNESGGSRVRTQGSADAAVRCERSSALETRELQGYMWPLFVIKRDENGKRPPKSSISSIDHQGKKVTGVLRTWGQGVLGVIEVWSTGSVGAKMDATLATSENASTEELQAIMEEASAKTRGKTKVVTKGDPDSGASSSKALKISMSSALKSKPQDDIADADDNNAWLASVWGEMPSSKIHKKKRGADDSSDSEEEPQQKKAAKAEPPTANADDAELPKQPSTKKPKQPQQKRKAPAGPSPTKGLSTDDNLTPSKHQKKLSKGRELDQSEVHRCFVIF